MAINLINFEWQSELVMITLNHSAHRFTINNPMPSVRKERRKRNCQSHVANFVGSEVAVWRGALTDVSARRIEPYLATICAATSVMSLWIILSAPTPTAMSRIPLNSLNRPISRIRRLLWDGMCEKS